MPLLLSRYTYHIIYIKYQGTICCGYGKSGGATAYGSKGAYDCLMIPGAVKKADSVVLPESQCGRAAGLVGEDAAAAAKASTLCCKNLYIYLTSLLIICSLDFSQVLSL